VNDMFKSRKLLGIALPIILLSIAFISAVSHSQIQPPTVYEIQSTRNIDVSETGTANVREEVKFSTQAFIVFKEEYNPMSTFVRDLEPRTSPAQIENLNINVDEANNKLTITYTLLGGAVYVGNGLWEIKIARPGEKLTLSSQHGNTRVFTHVYAAGSSYRIMETITVNLPAKAENIRYDDDEGKITYKLDVNNRMNEYMLYAGIALAVVGGVLMIMPHIMKGRKQGGSEEAAKPPAPPPQVSSESG